MTMKQLREHLDVRPFKPIVVRTVSGTRHEVRHSDYLFVSPVGDTILIVEEDGAMRPIGIARVAAVETQARRRKP